MTMKPPMVRNLYIQEVLTLGSPAERRTVKKIFTRCGRRQSQRIAAHALAEYEAEASDPQLPHYAPPPATRPSMSMSQFVRRVLQPT